jgi:hypothetical protein
VLETVGAAWRRHPFGGLEKKLDAGVAGGAALLRRRQRRNRG